VLSFNDEIKKNITKIKALFIYLLRVYVYILRMRIIFIYIRYIKKRIFKAFKRC